MSENWYYRVFGEEFGPVSLNDLRESATNGTLSSDDEVRPEALTMWIPAKAVRELQDLYEVAVESASTVTGMMNTAAESPAVTDEWYYRFSDTPETEVGPLPFDGIIELAKSGRLMADDEVRLGVDSKWRRAGNMGRLVAVLPYQTRRRNPAPLPTDEALEELEATPINAVQDLLDSLPDDAVEDPQTIVMTPRPKQRDTSSAPITEATDRKTSGPKSKSRQVDSKRTNKAAKSEPVDDSCGTAFPGRREVATPRDGLGRPSYEAKGSLSDDLQQDIEDQILETLMAPGPKTTATPAPLTMPMSSSPAALRAVEPIPQDAWATTPHVASSSPASFSRPTPTSRPLAKSYKPVRSGPSLAERFNDPKVIKGIAILVPILLIAAWMKMPESNAGDVEAYQKLDTLFTELRDTRKDDKDGKKLLPVARKLDAAAKEIAASMKKTADADHPARQALLWASQAVPKITRDGLGVEGPSEKEARVNLNRAAECLGLKEAAPTVVADYDNNEP